MFGFVLADLEALSEQDRKTYQSYYCGLCRAIGERFGNPSRLTLNFDMTFLVLFLTSYFSQNSEEEDFRCAIHPLKRKCAKMNKYTYYAADMNILLTKYKLADDVRDDNSLSAKVFARALEGGVTEVQKRYPQKDAEIKRCLDDLYKIEAAEVHNPDEASACFGRLMGEIFDVDSNDEKLRSFGFALGKVIYIMDACVDLKSDLRKCHFNPMVEIPSKNFQQILTILLSDCTEAYDIMNIEENKNIIENILFSGIWSRFRRAFS
ncbi:MAG: hypothetical protein IKB86_01945 [Clostridia bacterium]|nr:hypothetical protein [Clostridia bacterium]